jgi:hypothetical protein
MRKRVVNITGCSLVGAVILFLPLTGVMMSRLTGDSPVSTLMPWRNIGGCGAGGSGSGSNGIKWIGEGVSGGLLEIEMLPKGNFSRTFAYTVAAPRLTFTPFWNTEFGVSMPIGSKIAEVQYQTNLSEETVISGGRGDISVDFMRSFGSIAQYSLQFGLTFPTGRYDTERGSDLSKKILPQSLQMGQGIYSALLALYYTRDVDKGMFLFDGTFTYPFMFRLDRKNGYLETDYAAYKNVTVNQERFYYKHVLKPHGESDRGDYYPPSWGFDAIYAYRGVPKLVQSFQLFFQAPLGVRWIHSYVPTLYDPRPDPDNRAWDAVLSYAIEFSRESFPLFMGIGLPIHDTRGVVGQDQYDPSTFGAWSAPDWEAIGNEWIVALGFKAAVF